MAPVRRINPVIDGGEVATPINKPATPPAQTAPTMSAQPMDERRESIERARQIAAFKPETTATTTPVVKDGDAGPTPVDVTEIDDAGKAAALAFGLTEQLLAAFPELQNVYNLFLAGNETDARIAYQKSGYYQNLTKTSRDRQTMKATQPGAYKTELDQFIIEQQRRLVQRGIRLDDATLRSMLEKAYDDGLSEEQIDLKALTTFKGDIGGETLGAVQSLKSYAAAFGVGYQQPMFDQWSKDIFAGTITVNDVQARIRQDSASAFPAYAEQINRGVSMDAIASAYKTSMAEILERDPESITFNDSRLRKALQYTIDGKPAVMPLWEFEKQIRSTPEWMNTKDARDTIESLSFKVLSDWGLA